MSIHSPMDLIPVLSQHRLLEPAQLESLRTDLAPRFTTAQELADELAQRGWLTPFQVHVLLRGKGDQLCLGPYVLLEKLGEGGTGRVFKARHQAMRRIVAVKLVRAELLTDPEVVRRFYREIDVMSQLHHPNIVAAYDAGPVGPTHLLAMEYIEGTELARLVEQVGPLPLAQALDYVRQAALGLQHAHENGMVHRDIKPSNLLLTGRVVSGGGVSGAEPTSLTTHLIKILDLGLARCQQTSTVESANGPLTAHGDGTTMGTPDYLAPEQALDFHAADIRADIYGLGCTFYFLLTGQPPFAGGTMAEKLMRHQQTEPPALASLRPDVPAALAVVVRKMLAKRPQDRFQTPGEVAEVLAQLAEGKDVALSLAHAPALPMAPLAPVASKDTLIWSGRFRRPGTDRHSQRWTVGGGVLFLVLLAVFLTLLFRSDPGGRRDTVADRRQPATEARPVFPFLPEPIKLLIGDPLSPAALTASPAPVEKALGWTVETRDHRGPVRVVAYSPDGRWLASAGFDNTIRIWEPRSGRLVRCLIGHANGQGITALAWSPDSKMLASGGQSDGTVRVWHADTGYLLRSIAETHNIFSLAWSSDSKQLAVAAEVPTSVVRIYNVATGQHGRPLQGFEGHVFATAWRPGRRVVASGGGDKHVRIWDAPSGKCVGTLGEHSAAIRSVCWSPDGKLLAVYSEDSAVRLWEVDANKSLVTLAGPGFGGFAFNLGWSPDGATLACVGGDLRLWEMPSGKPVRITPSGMTSLSWSPDSKQLAIGGQLGHAVNGAVQLWDVGSGKMVRDAPGHPQGRAGLHSAWSPDSRTLAVLDSPLSGTGLWETPRGQLLRVLKGHEGHVCVAAWSPDGKVLATASHDRTVRLWEPASGMLLHTLAGHEQRVVCLAWSPGGKVITSGAADKTIRTWDALEGKPLKTLAGHPEHVNALAFSPDGKTLASLDSRDPQLRLWDIDAGTVRQEVGNGVGVAVAWSPDGKVLASAGMDGETPVVRVWDTGPVRPRHAFRLASAAHSLAWLGDSQTLVTVSSNGELSRWNTLKGEALRGHKEMAGAGTFSPDRSLLAGAAFDNARLWKTETGHVRGTLLMLRDDLWLAAGAEGHYRGPPAVERELVCVVQTGQGQETLSLTEFAQKFEWKNDPDQVRLVPAK